jgi:hypothetical protein
MSSLNSVVDAVGPADNASQGARHRCHSKLGGGHYQTCWQCPPRGAAIDVLQQLVAVASIHYQRLPRGHW